MVFIKLRGWANYNVNHCVNILEYQILDIRYKNDWNYIYYQNLEIIGFGYF